MARWRRSSALHKIFPVRDTLRFSLNCSMRMLQRIALPRYAGRWPNPAASMGFRFLKWSAARITIPFSFRGLRQQGCCSFRAGMDTAIGPMNTRLRRILRGERWCWRSRLQRCPPDALWMKEKRRQAAALQRRDPSSSAAADSSGQESFVGFLVNHNRPPLPAFFISVDFKGTLSCFRINTSRSVDSKGGYGRYYRTLSTSVDPRWLGTWAG